MGGKCKFNEAWLAKYSWLKSVVDDPNSAFCKLCNTQFKVDSKGETSLTRHADGEKHKSLATKEPMHLTNFFRGECIQSHSEVSRNTKKSYVFVENLVLPSDESLELAAKEATVVYHMVKENQTFGSTTCLSQLIRTVFGFSKFKCAETKADAILSGKQTQI